MSDFSLAVSLETLTVVTINAEGAYTTASDKIRLPVTKVFLRAAVGSLAKSKKLRNWVDLNAVFLLPFITEEVILKGDMVVG